MNILIQAGLAAVLAATGVTVAVTQSRPETLKVQRWVPSIVIKGQGHDGLPLWYQKNHFATEAECQAFIKNDPTFADDLRGLLIQELTAHFEDPTFDLEDPVCRQRDMDPPGLPT